MQDLDYKKIRLKVGLEIHQQLDTSKKLFCNCPNKISDEDPDFTVFRKLRPTQSEMGEVDQAALFEFGKGKNIVYESPPATSCLVELDEEPPHDLNQEAVDVALVIALLLNAEPVNEIHVMRKIVIDGSNTTGFQRTCVVALNGCIKIGELEVPIQHLGLEEDAARKVEESKSITKYRIDRLCIPLIEVATGPVIRNPKEAEEVAFAIGRILRATRKVKRGLGTIRQDLNISIEHGAVIEIKGVQKLDLISKIVENEAKRQLKLLEIQNDLGKKLVNENDLKDEFVDVSDIFRKTSCKVLKNGLSKEAVILAILLKNFEGMLGIELCSNLKFGTELAHRAIFWGKVGGIFHTDELPKYGITQEEVDALRKKMKASESDAVVFVADREENAVNALKAVIERSKEAFHGVPEETRGATPEGITRYMRPRPGAARMYPETDVPPTVIDSKRISNLKNELPPLPNDIIESMTKKYEINSKLAEQLMDSDYLGLFEKIVAEMRLTPSFIATILTENMKNLEREGFPVDQLSENRIYEAFKAVNEGLTAKESIVELLQWASKNKESSIDEAINDLGIGMLNIEQLKQIIMKIVKDEEDVITKQPGKAFNRLLGIIMREVRGKADVKIVSDLLRNELKMFEST
jgi:glutamyl-tRNA(Gln) amidotransferase subunit E